MTNERQQKSPSEETSTLLEPGFYKSWYEGLRFLRDALMARFIFGAILLAVCIIRAFFFVSPGSGLIELGLLVYIAHEVIQRVHASKAKLPLAQVAKEAGEAETRMFFNTMVFDFCAAVFTLFLVAPGFWFASRASLAIIFVSLEGKGPIKSILSSFELTRGHFRKTLGFMLLGPLSFFLAIIIPYFILLFLVSISIDPSNTEGAKMFLKDVDKYSLLILNPVLVLLQLTIYKPMYDLYWYYKKLKEEKEAVSN
ncbi:MAG: hypothetical protein KC652_17190 [Cyanobacteria bacterium HKST-UBA01]|nr:hypothetical protein [Cyanobacteria bacterium HKST-UBA01]